MPSLLNKVLRHRWFIMGLHGGLWLLLCLTIAHLGGKAPDYHEADVVGNPPQSPAPVAGLERLFLPSLWPKSLADTHQLNPFYTTTFVPPVPQAPTTRKILVSYQGYSQVAAGPKIIYFRVDDAISVGSIGTKIAPELFIADATMQALTLTNVTAQTNIVGLNTNREIIVPIK